ncbi:MAG: tRNA 2-thiouridine(34) synthase MnmA [bacterium]|nr:tRNA 2-thiouridine(34) synthase MnmA [bacterium]
MSINQNNKPLDPASGGARGKPLDPASGGARGKPPDSTRGKPLNTTRGKKVFVAMSGGVDSSVAAALLVQSGEYEVIGAYMKCWSEGAYCTSAQDAEDARRVAEKLHIPFYVFDLEKEYRASVFDYMVREYKAGLTPNPDVMCNKEIKFGVFLNKARSLGADYIATGHYVRKAQSAKFKTQNEKSAARYMLHVARDINKDQSYFLWTLTQDQLKHALFPIGGYEKREVRAMAKKFGLPTHAKKDSQGLCFVGNIDFRSFMQEVLPKRSGKILTTGGKEIGTHEGAEFYTIGQRHGIGVGGGIPYYVTDKDVSINTITVAEGPYEEALFKTELRVRDAHWISGVVPELPLECEVRIRYRQPLQVARIMNYESRITEETLIPNSKFLIQFKDPQRAVTPGQSIVFYSMEEGNLPAGRQVLGGAIIS